MAKKQGQEFLSKMLRLRQDTDTADTQKIDDDVASWVKAAMTQIDKDITSGRGQIYFGLIGARSKKEIGDLEKRKIAALAAELGIALTVDDVEVHTSDDPVGYMSINRDLFEKLLAA